MTLVDFDPDAENKLLAAICYPHSHLPEEQLLDKVARLGAAERLALVRAYVGERENRRHKPGRAFERIDYRFDVLADYGAFRDLQRHRLLTIEWQPLSPRHGYVRPELVDDAGQAAAFDEAMSRSAQLYDALVGDFPEQAAYAVSMAYRLRFVMQFNAREAIHLLELRSGAEGHPGLPADRPRHAPVDRRTGRPSHRRRGDDPPHDGRPGVGASGVRAARRGAPRLTPDPVRCDGCHKCRAEAARNGGPRLRPRKRRGNGSATTDG